MILCIGKDLNNKINNSIYKNLKIYTPIFLVYIYLIVLLNNYFLIFFNDQPKRRQPN